MDFGFQCIAAASAAAHAVSHASAYVQEFVKNLPMLLEEEENPGWVLLCAIAEKAVTSHALLPLHNAYKCLAHIVGRGVSTVRSGTIRHMDPSVQPVLRSSPPTADFLFGDPALQVT